MPFTLRFDAVLFDLDGTLLLSEKDLIASVRHALAAVDHREPPDDDTIIMEVGKPLETILRELQYPAGPDEAKLFADTYREHFARTFGTHTKLAPLCLEVLDALGEAGVKRAVVTTKHQAQADFVVGKMGLAPRLELVRGWQEGRKHKPDPEPFLEAAAALGVARDRALVVGDTEQDIGAAKDGGLTCCAVTWGFRPILLLKSLRPDYIISQLRDVLSIAATPTG
ncbi:HAD-IA family hydrolase [candidate division WOR-3 bacterium]|nr:HAD-IA family hydrolase [candidate division WOR-3 bacterium]